MPIRTPDQRLRVFISSTLGELAAERQAVARSITALRMTPVMFEQGARPHPPQDVYRAYLTQSDIFVGLYWQRYGEPAPGMDVSGLDEELQLAGWLPRLLYLKAPAPDREPKLAEMLSRIKVEATDSYRHFRTPSELGRFVRDDLATLLSERFAIGASTAADSAGGQDRAPQSHGTQQPRARPAEAPVPAPPLPASTTVLIGRGPAIDEVCELVMRPSVRLVSLTGPGGIGKTRLATAAAEKVAGQFRDGAGIVFVPLASVTRPEQVLAAIGRASGANLAETGAVLDALAEHFGADQWLMILDNLEQVVGAARDVGELLTRCPGLTVLATSRTVLRLQAEREYPVPALAIPAPGGSAADIAGFSAVALFVDRATAVRRGFALTDANAEAVGEICRRLEGLPLAIELAAARARLLDPPALLERLTRSLDALGTGTAEMPERQQTLRATVEWSVGLLHGPERALLQVLSVFVDGWTTDAAAAVGRLAEDEAISLCEGLAQHSLIYYDSDTPGSRAKMLDTIRVFVAEQLAVRNDADEIGRRHAEYYRMLAERAGTLLRREDWNEWTGRLDAEAGNVAATVRWYLRADPRVLPRLFRDLLPFWATKSNDLVDVRTWVDQLLPTADSLDSESLAELLWTAAVTARDVGDDQTAVAARERLGPLLDSIEDQYLRAVCVLAMSWTTAILGDVDSALGMASTSLDLLREQDEPLWTTVALVSVGSMETFAGRYDDALAHLSEARELAARYGIRRLTNSSTVQLGVLAVMRGRPAEARPLLDEGLGLSISNHSMLNASAALGGYALLAIEDGEPERAAVLTGAADGLPLRVGLRPWPAIPRLVDRLRETLGTDRHQDLLAAGQTLSLRQAAETATEPYQPARG